MHKPYRYFSLLIIIGAFFTFTVFNNSISAQDDIATQPAFRQAHRSEPADFQRRDWMFASNLSQIRYIIGDHPPADEYVLGPVESSNWEGWNPPYFWITSWNPIRCNWMDIETPSYLQLWIPSYDDCDSGPVKEITHSLSMIGEIGWLDAGDEHLLYVMINTSGAADFLCYKLLNDEPYIELLSSQPFFWDVGWIEEDIADLGTCFIFLDTVNRYEPPPINTFEFSYLIFCPVTETGVVETYYIHLNDFLTVEEISTYIRHRFWAEDVIQYLSVTLRTSEEWQNCIKPWQ